jgi:RimJ/RimL family protein N-acetyltransferase
MTLGSPSFQAAIAAWAAELGCAPEVLAVARTTVIGHGPAFGDGRVAFALAATTTDACVVTVPADWQDAARAALAPLPPTEAFDARRLAAVFGPAADRVVGPAWQGHVDAGGFAPVDPRGAWPLLAADRADLSALAMACDAHEWEASTVDPDRPPVFGCVADGRLVAAGTLAPWRDRFWHVGIVTHPGYRGRGYGRAVVSAMTRYGLDHGWLLHYQTLLANAPSVAIARSLGYRQHAQTLAIRLTAA